MVSCLHGDNVALWCRLMTSVIQIHNDDVQKIFCWGVCGDVFTFITLTFFIFLACYIVIPFAYVSFSFLSVHQSASLSLPFSTSLHTPLYTPFHMMKILIPWYFFSVFLQYHHDFSHYLFLHVDLPSIPQHCSLCTSPPPTPPHIHNMRWQLDKAFQLLNFKTLLERDNI